MDLNKISKPLICIPVMGKTKEELIQEMKVLSSYTFDMLEWRMDYLDDLKIENVLDCAKTIYELNTDKELLFTFRSFKEGGEKEIGEEEYISLNKSLIESGITSYIDVEMFSFKKAVEEIISYAHLKNVKVIGSYHDFTKTENLEEIMERFENMQNMQADISKIAMVPNKIEDVYTLMQATYNIKNKNKKPLISMSMKEMGKPSRILGELFGSSVTFGCVQKASAPGQIELEELKKLLEYVHTCKEEAVETILGRKE